MPNPPDNTHTHPRFPSGVTTVARGDELAPAPVNGQPSNTEVVASVEEAGRVQVPERTYEYDVEIGAGYQRFSAEILRLCLLGIGGIGFLLVNLDPSSDGEPSRILQNLGQIVPGIRIALGAFGFGAAGAVAHRYAATNSLAYQLQHLRYVGRGDHVSPFEDVYKKAAATKASRDRWFTASRGALLVATSGLAAGALALASAFADALHILAAN